MIPDKLKPCDDLTDLNRQIFHRNNGGCERLLLDAESWDRCAELMDLQGQKITGTTFWLGRKTEFFMFMTNYIVREHPQEPEPSLSAWDQKLKEELDAGVDTWGRIENKYRRKK